MKTRAIEQKVYLEKDEVLAYIVTNMGHGSNEDFVEVANLLRKQAGLEEIQYEEETDQFSYTVISHELMTWEEEVEDMSYFEVLGKFQKLLLSKKSLFIPKFPDHQYPCNFDDRVEIYIRNIVKENEIE